MSNHQLPEKELLFENLGKIEYTLDKAYLNKLTTDFVPLPFEETVNADEQITYPSNIRSLEVTRWVYDKKQKIADCFKNVLSLFADGDHSLALVVKKSVTATKMYFVVKNIGDDRNEDSKNNLDLLQKSINGNFSGSQSKKLDDNNADDTDYSNEVFDFQNAGSIAVLVNMPSEKSEDYISQGLDKLLNGVLPKSKDEEYTVVFLAESLSQENAKELISGFEDMATAISPYVSYQFQLGENENKTEGEMSSLSNSTSISDAISKTHSVNLGINVGGANTIGRNIGGSVGFFGIGASAGISKAFSLFGGLSAGYGYSKGKIHTDTHGNTDTTGRNESLSIGSSHATTYTYKSQLVSNVMNKLEKTMVRINENQGNGLWKFSTYVVANDGTTSKNVANFLRSLTQGEESFVESSSIQEWSRDNKDNDVFPEICKYLSHFTHPLFLTGNQQENTIVTPTAYVGTNELSHVISFPRKSLQGLPVVNCVQFGREAHGLDKLNFDLRLGNGYHMYQEVQEQGIFLSMEELTKHTFITGSTGSGKSNTIYTLLDKLTQEKKKFLVIEPTKGEYKNVFGTREDVKVYGTNPNLTPMLRINPFKFSEKIHILEHLDRLVDIFNVCWPMYAAMPAILKEAMERAYESAGWDLKKSINTIPENLFPTFADVLDQISVVMHESEYSSDNKGDYIGALSTRIRSLTNGINGMIFTQNDLTDEELFEENVVVDLSRVGSIETKALIMGLLVMKLSEYYMVSDYENAKLHHVTVLEEAHNLLKRTSTEQVSESANLLGKSVEMLSNAIAEMRTYGEGFIIADQSPHMLDMSVIRNTNTKIIMKLPDESDRELVGKSANLNDEQIVELSRLKTGVAAVFQNNWLEPVLCQVDRFSADIDKNGNILKYKYPIADVEEIDMKAVIIKMVLMNQIEKDMKTPEFFVESDLKVSIKKAFFDVQTGTASKSKLFYELFVDPKTFHNVSSSIDGEKCLEEISRNTVPSLSGYDYSLQKEIVIQILEEQTLRNRNYEVVLNKINELSALR
ncbi:MAG: DUF87 domain-containing protein [Eubacteriales bacterium]